MLRLFVIAISWVLICDRLTNFLSQSLLVFNDGCLNGAISPLKSFGFTFNLKKSKLKFICGSFELIKKKFLPSLVKAVLIFLKSFL